MLFLLNATASRATVVARVRAVAKWFGSPVAFDVDNKPLLTYTKYVNEWLDFVKLKGSLSVDIGIFLCLMCLRRKALWFCW